jgi:hypothetical protein
MMYVDGQSILIIDHKNLSALVLNLIVVDPDCYSTQAKQHGTTCNRSSTAGNL